MKRLFLLLAFAATMFVGCSDSYDDSAIWKELGKLEQEQEKMQEQIDAQQKLLEALSKQLTIISVTPTEDGYEILFSDNSTITVNYGQDNDSLFADIAVSEDSVSFTLADGTVVVVPLAGHNNGGDSGDSGDSAENNKIYYTTTDGKKLFPNNSGGAAFGAILISNTYIDGQGVLTFDDSVTAIGWNAFDGCSSLTSVTIPDSVTTIGGSAFSGCSSLTSVTIPDSVTTIGNYAFEDCSSLTSVTIPDSVTAIGWNAFDGCSSLTSVYCKAVTPPALALNYYGDCEAFDNNASGRKIYVPMESVEAYKSASGWSEYKSSIVGYNF